MLRTLVARSRPAAVSRLTDLPPLLAGVQVFLVVMVLITVPLADPDFGSGAQGTAQAAALGVSAVSWTGWLLLRRRPWLLIVMLAVMGAAGGVLAGVSPTLSTAIAVPLAATSAAGSRLASEVSLAITAWTIAAFLATGLAMGAAAQSLLGYPVAFAGLWAFGLTRHAYLSRAEQAEVTLSETRRAREAETEAAALGERARIAREIHDVLAHSLAAVSVNLQAAEALLGGLPDSPELGKAVECIGRAGAFTREGLADARRAILALRGDAPPLPAQLSALAGEFRADGDTIEFTVTGPPRPLPAEAGLAAYRTAQEALTNARKHAPGQPVSLTLEFADGEIRVRAANPLPAAGTSAPLAGTGAGYGLAGLRERAVLGGGSLTAGAAGTQWQVCLRIPA